MIILRILLGVACLSLLNASQAEAQLLRRLRVQPQPQPQRYAPQPQRYAPQPQRYAPQPQRYVPQPVTQNGYQGRLTASQRSRPVYVRRPDGSVVPYYPNTARVQRPQAQLNPVQVRAAAVANGQLRPNIATTQGQLIPVRPTVQPQPQFSNVRLRSAFQRPATTAGVAPVGVSVLSQPQPQLQPQPQALSQPKAEKKVVSSIAPATAMPEATMSLGEPASSIPVNTAATNPAPTGLSLSLDNDIAPASADVDVEPTPAADAILDSNGQETFSVLETID